MNILPLETWVSIGALFTAALGLAAFMRSMVVDLRVRIDGVDTKIDRVDTTLSARIDKLDSSLSARIDKLESSLSERIDKLDTKTDRVDTNLSERIDRIDARIATLDDRVYSLAVGLRPLLDRAEKASPPTKSTRSA